MQNVSRRAFFGGKAPEVSQWDQLLLQLQRKTQGKLIKLDQEEQVAYKPSLLTDLHHARQLCHAFDVNLYVLGLQAQVNDELKPIVWLDLTALNQLKPLDPQKNQWFVQAGVRIGQLKEVGFNLGTTVPDELTVANWLADSLYHPYSLAQLRQSGLVHASLLTADGSVNSLGLFGEQNTKPLNTAFLRRVVPQVFQLATSDLAQTLLEQPRWLGRYRWDVFNPKNTELNLAYLLLGHAGDLGVIEWVVLNQENIKTPAPSEFISEENTTLQIAAEEFDAAIKQLFDPDGLFSFGVNSHSEPLNVVPQHV